MVIRAMLAAEISWIRRIALLASGALPQVRNVIGWVFEIK
jgi:hypothetical protein